MLQKFLEQLFWITTANEDFSKILHFLFVLDFSTNASPWEPQIISVRTFENLP